MDMIAWLFIACFLFALWHFVYENILSPTIRDEARFQLFALRDELRHMRHENPEELSLSLFQHLELLINTAIHRMDQVNFVSVSRAIARLRTDERRRQMIQREIEDLLNEIRRSEIDRLESIHYEIHRSFYLSLLINSGGWLPYTPLLVVVPVWQNRPELLRRPVKFLKEGIKSILYQPNDNHYKPA